VNLADLTKLVRDALDAAGKTKVPVVAPGTPISVMPSVVLAPAFNELENGNRTLRYGFDVTVVVPRFNQPEQYEQLTELETIVVSSLVPSEARFDGPFSFTTTGGDGTGEPPALARTIPISFVADVDLCP